MDRFQRMSRRPCQMDRRNSVEKAKRDAVRALAGAVLGQARTDWKKKDRHDEVEAFLDGRLIDLYLDIAGIDRGEYLHSVRGDDDLHK
jgi:hypothetical protein